MVNVIGIKFTGRHAHGDFSYMISQPQYNDALFIYNDNVESYQNHNFTQKGAGNAVIRPFRFTKPPRAMPIPTGFRPSVGKAKGFDNPQPGGFQMLDENVKRIIDEAIDEIRYVITTYNYQRVFYSVGDDGLIGTSIFHVNDDVRRYITDSLMTI